MGVGGVVILYHPAAETMENILSYLPYLDMLYVADNTEGKLSHVADQLRHLHNVKIIHDAENMGIAKRLNHAAALAIAADYNWLLTMDQDSKFGGDDMQRYLLCAGSYANKSKTAVFGVEYEQFRGKMQAFAHPLKKTVSSLREVSLILACSKTLVVLMKDYL